jgi:hypothetical protein
VLLASDEASYIAGTVYTVAGGMPLPWASATFGYRASSATINADGPVVKVA